MPSQVSLDSLDLISAASYADHRIRKDVDLSGTFAQSERPQARRMNGRVTGQGQVSQGIGCPVCRDQNWRRGRGRVADYRRGRGRG